ncbi:MAG: DUF2267 domain-containing protein [Myxococcota bacterium]|nr:DUF2267 domain-containing protein [Myxococcota bacterium]
MPSSEVPVLNRTVQQSREWIHELAREEGLGDDGHAYDALRAVLHALRDRLTVEEGAHLAAQLPTLVRGVYYEGFRPARVPQRLRTREAFLERVAKELPAGVGDPEAAAKAVFRLLDRHITPGEMQHVRNLLPDDFGPWLEDPPLS